MVISLCIKREKCARLCTRPSAGNLKLRAHKGKREIEEENLSYVGKVKGAY